MKLFPHPALSESHVEWGEWRIVTSDSSEVLGDQLKGWDYQQELNLQVDCQLNVADACRDLGVGPDELVCLATVDCPSTSRRFFGIVSPAGTARLRSVESDYEGWEKWSGAGGKYYVGFWDEGGTWAVTDEVDVVLEEAGSRDAALDALQRIDSGSGESRQVLTCSITVPSESVAKRLDMAVQFVVRPVKGGSHGPGARVLLGPTKRVDLEGDGARFPTEPVSFKHMGWPDSLWRLKFMFDSVEDAYGGAVRLFVNVDHPGASSLLDPQAATGQMTRAFLRLDIVRVVLTSLGREAAKVGALGLPDFESDDGSVLAVANALSSEWLKLDLDEAIHLLQQSPGDFEARLQATALDLGKRAFA